MIDQQAPSSVSIKEKITNKLGAPQTSSSEKSHRFFGLVLNSTQSKLILIVLLVIITGLIYLLLIRQQQIEQERFITPTTVDELTEEELISKQELQVRIESIVSAQLDLAEVDQSIQPAVEQSARLDIVSPRIVYQQGEAIEAQVLLQAAVIPDGVELVIKYDPEFINQVEMIQDNNFGSFLMSQVEAQAGTITAILLRNPGEEVDLTQPLSILKIKGAAKQSGKTSLVFDLDKTGVAAAGGQKVLSGVTHLTLQIE